MGIEIRKSICRVCSRGCPIDVEIADEQIRQITPSNPQAGGQLCALGYAYKEYVTRPDRIRTPLRRVGERGSGQWESITWEEAYREIGDKLLKLRAEYGVFDDEADVWILNTGNHQVLGIGRYYRGEKLLALFNFSKDPQAAWVFDETMYTDLAGGRRCRAGSVRVPAGGYRWLYKKMNNE